MSVRNQDASLKQQLVDIQDRLNRLETQNNKTRKNDIRLSDTVVTADSENDRLCLENLISHKVVCIGEAVDTVVDPAQAIWSFSGDIVSANEGDSSPAFSMERDANARQIIVAQPCGQSFSGTLKICVDFCDGGAQVLVSLLGSAGFSVREINIPMVENDRIMCTIFDAAVTAANNISVFVRFGTPTVPVTTGNECAS